ncbi:protein phosphatase 1 regulatory subunit 3B-like isoform X2 [Littorina saxatilis]|uniref:CBM21 domain-containing protein n=2 Tax=Littorina saxatilis TaxID=31220 RepID=A0AAN9BRK2_9CAEN
MLDIAPSLDRSARSTMPLDFNSYLLSASPPNSCFELHNYTSFMPRPFDSPPPQDCKKVCGDCPLNSRRNGPLKPIIIKSDSESEVSSSPTSDCDSTPTSPCSPGKMRKRVVFADHCGKALAQVRIMSEASDEPPNFKPELLAAITHGEQASITDKPPLKLTFTQPASDYMAFRDKLEKNLISLENVILNDYTVQGTIKVKNVSFQKRVLVRYTSSSWESHTDIVTTYNPGPADVPGRPSQYDTFTFSFEVPPNADASKKVEFAVCYEADGVQHWDNNDGQNYGVVWDTYQPPAPAPVTSNDNNNNPFIFGPTSLADFACWHHIDGSTPYY